VVLTLRVQLRLDYKCYIQSVDVKHNYKKLGRRIMLGSLIKSAFGIAKIGIAGSIALKATRPKQDSKAVPASRNNP